MNEHLSDQVPPLRELDLFTSGTPTSIASNLSGPVPGVITINSGAPVEGALASCVAHGWVLIEVDDAGRPVRAFRRW